MKLIHWHKCKCVLYISDITRYADRQKKFLDEIKQTLTESQKMYYYDTYFNTVMERSTRLQNAPANSRAREYGVSSDFSSVFLGVDHALLSRTPKARYPVGYGSQLTMFIMNHCPNWMLDLILTASTFTYREKGLKPPPNMRFEWVTSYWNTFLYSFPPSLLPLHSLPACLLLSPPTCLPPCPATLFHRPSLSASLPPCPSLSLPCLPAYLHTSCLLPSLSIPLFSLFPLQTQYIYIGLLFGFSCLKCNNNW